MAIDTTLIKRDIPLSIWITTMPSLRRNRLTKLPIALILTVARPIAQSFSLIKDKTRIGWIIEIDLEVDMGVPMVLIGMGP